MNRLGLKLAYVLETHAHADHVTSAGKLCQQTGAKAAVPAGYGIAGAELQLRDGDTVPFGEDEKIQVLHTPGHTAGSMSFLWHGNVFAGDTLLIDGCGRTDFQSGSAKTLYHSVHEKLFSLPESTLVWPGHDYKGRSVSTVGWEKAHNSRLVGLTEAGFIALMDKLGLPEPRLIDIAVPPNQVLGLVHSG